MPMLYVVFQSVRERVKRRWAGIRSTPVWQVNSSHKHSGVPLTSRMVERSDAPPLPHRKCDGRERKTGRSLMSTSGNSDPRTNGRRYYVVTPGRSLDLSDTPAARPS